MKRFISGLLALGLLVALSPIARSDDAVKFLVAADSSSGTYKQMLGQIIAMCSTDQFTITQIENAGGALGNLEAMLNNKAQAAFMHSDVLVAAALNQPNLRDKYKTLLALYGEDIHVVALRNSKTSEGGVLGIGAKTKEFNTLADLDNYKVGAAGGGTRTMQILIGTGGARFTPVNYDKGADVLAALDKGEIQAAIFVGGAPLPNIEKLSGETYKLIGIDDTFAARLNGVYDKRQITYTNLKANQVPTLAPVATLVTRVYKTKKFIDGQVKFRTCFYEKLDEMKETPDLHPKWQEVEK